MIKFSVLAFFCVALMGCSAKQKIYDTANHVSTKANSSVRSATEIVEISTQPVVVSLAESIVADQEDILEATEIIKEATTKVKDIVPWWVQLAERIGLILILAAAIYFTWVYIVPIRMLIGRFLPARRRAAKMLRKVTQGDMEPREFVANWRADPANEAAYRAEKKKEALNGTK